MASIKPRRILVTAGNTQVPIDQVRCISNIFKGRTGTQIAERLAYAGHDVHLLTSNRRLAQEARAFHADDFPTDSNKFGFTIYTTYDDLLREMERLVKTGDFDTIIHSAAVSDYFVDGVCIIDAQGDLVDVPKDGKVGSDHGCLYLRMLPTQKIIDLIRDPWGFQGTLVKFKLQVGMTDDQLIHIASYSMRQSKADVIVANCLEWSEERAIIIKALPGKAVPKHNPAVHCLPVPRRDLPRQLTETLQEIWEKKHDA